jgi:L-amino acid N-acyltransferase YncA
VGDQFIIRAAVPADLEPVAAICAHYVTTTVTTFEEVPPTAADWQRRLDDLARRNLPFLVADQDGTVCGYAYASPWRPKPAYRYTVEDTVYVSPAHTGAALAAPCSARCSPGASRPARGRSSRSSPTPAATPRPSCTGGWASG